MTKNVTRESKNVDDLGESKRIDGDLAACGAVPRGSKSAAGKPIPPSFTNPSYLFEGKSALIAYHFWNPNRLQLVSQPILKRRNHRQSSQQVAVFGKTIYLRPQIGGAIAPFRKFNKV